MFSKINFSKIGKCLGYIVAVVSFVISIWSFEISKKTSEESIEEHKVSLNSQSLVISGISKENKNLYKFDVTAGAIANIHWYSIYGDKIGISPINDNGNNIPITNSQKNHTFDLSNLTMEKDQERLYSYSRKFFALITDFKGNKKLYMILVSGNYYGTKRQQPKYIDAKYKYVELVDDSYLPLQNSIPETASMDWYIKQIKTYDEIKKQFQEYNLITN
ncbi:hypothetical protein QMA56_09530 [Leuconostoc falkenbergense]|uniref:hypothetical protein n=1 Tax=Leuconostoc falkenbergense TaxID=2766470 RepID=UPI0024ACF61E|nr:hypothetical protein [Leuconostoc falkenbergense]MDI6667943.1 hypothetical protein [Leuconostoc falkenbergense]